MRFNEDSVRDAFEQFSTSSPDSDSRQEALDFLQEFGRSVSPWSVCLSLIDTTDERLQFFAAQMIHQNFADVQREIDSNILNEVLKFLLRRLASLDPERDLAVHTRLALAVATVYLYRCQTEEQKQWLFGLLESEAASTVLKVVQLISEELESVVLPREIRDLARTYLISMSSDLISATTDAKPFAIGLNAMSAWVKHGLIAAPTSALFSYASVALEETALLRPAVKCLVELIQLSESSSGEAFSEWIVDFLDNEDLFIDAFTNGTDLALPVAEIISAVLETQIEFMAANLEDELVRTLELHLYALQQGSWSVVEIAIETLPFLQDWLSDELKESYFRRSLIPILWRSLDHAKRTSVLRDALSCHYEVLHSDYFDILFDEFFETPVAQIRPASALSEFRILDPRFSECFLWAFVALEGLFFWETTDPTVLEAVFPHFQVLYYLISYILSYVFREVSAPPIELLSVSLELLHVFAPVWNIVLTGDDLTDVVTSLVGMLSNEPEEVRISVFKALCSICKAEAGSGFLAIGDLMGTLVDAAVLFEDEDSLTAAGEFAELVESLTVTQAYDATYLFVTSVVSDAVSKLEKRSRLAPALHELAALRVFFKRLEYTYNSDFHNGIGALESFITTISESTIRESVMEDAQHWAAGDVEGFAVPIPRLVIPVVYDHIKELIMEFGNSASFADALFSLFSALTVQCGFRSDDIRALFTDCNVLMAEHGSPEAFHLMADMASAAPDFAEDLADFGAQIVREGLSDIDVDRLSEVGEHLAAFFRLLRITIEKSSDPVNTLEIWTFDWPVIWDLIQAGATLFYAVTSRQACLLIKSLVPVAPDLPIDIVKLLIAALVDHLLLRLPAAREAATVLVSFRAQELELTIPDMICSHLATYDNIDQFFSSEDILLSFCGSIIVNGRPRVIRESLGKIGAQMKLS